MKRKTFHCGQDIVVCSQTGSIVICNHFIRELHAYITPKVMLQSKNLSNLVRNFESAANFVHLNVSFTVCLRTIFDLREFQVFSG